MKKLTAFLALAISMTSTMAFADSQVEVQTAKNRENTINITITGEAAEQISAQLSKNGINMRREPFSGAMVQSGTGIRCITEHSSKPLYCSISVVGAEVN